MLMNTIVVDLDRTLLHTDKTLSDYTVNILKRCKRNGIKIVVATARPLRTTIPYCDKIPFDAMVVSNGARIICGEYRTEYKIRTERAICLLNSLKSYPDLRITVETGDCAYSNKRIDDYDTIITEDLIGIVETEGVLKILVHLDHEDVLAFVKEKLTDDLYYTVANGYLLQIMSREATKWNGIKAMLELSKTTPLETVYFGDDHDDIEPIKMCGMGVAVSNAIDEVKDVADAIAGNNDEDGVAKFIERKILESS